MDKNEILQTAKERVFHDETDPEYPVFLFTAIRAVYQDILPFKEAAKIVLSECRGDSINWKDIFKVDPSSYGCLPEEVIEDLGRAFDIEPKSSLGNLIYLEAYMMAGKSVDSFAYHIDLIKESFQEPPNYENIIKL